MDTLRKAYVLGGLSVLLWSTVATAFKLALAHLDPLQLLLLANAFSLAALLFILASRGRLRLLTTMDRRELARQALLGLLNPFLYYTVLFQAYALLPAQEAQPLNYTWAITLTLLSVPLLGQRLSGRDLAAIAISWLGVLVISTHGDITGLRFSSVPGVALALGSTLIWALFWIGNTRSKADPAAALCVNFAAALPCTLCLCLAASGLPSLSWPGLAAAAYVGFFEMGVTFVLWLSAMRLAAQSPGGTARVANLIFLSPFLSLVFIHFLLGERILPATILGLGLIVGGNALQRLGRAA